MFVEVIGGSSSQKKHTKSMVEFCAKKLMPRLHNLDITVNLCKPKGAIGFCLLWTPEEPVAMKALPVTNKMTSRKKRTFDNI